MEARRMIWWREYSHDHFSSPGYQQEAKQHISHTYNTYTLTIYMYYVLYFTTIILCTVLTVPLYYVLFLHYHYTTCMYYCTSLPLYYVLFLQYHCSLPLYYVLFLHYHTCTYRISSKRLCGHYLFQLDHNAATIQGQRLFEIQMPRLLFSSALPQCAVYSRAALNFVTGTRVTSYLVPSHVSFQQMQ